MKTTRIYEIDLTAKLFIKNILYTFANRGLQ